MLRIQLNYRINVKDYRSAVYFGTFTRHSGALKILIGAVAGATLYTVGGAAGLWPLSYWPACVAVAYLGWLLILCTQIERSVLKYLKSEKMVVGKPISVKITEENYTVDIPDLGSHYTIPVVSLFMVFETSRMFSVYYDQEKTLLIPHHATTPEQRVALRELFADKLKDRFFSRFRGVIPQNSGPFGGLFGGGNNPLSGRKRLKR